MNSLEKNFQADMGEGADFSFGAKLAAKGVGLDVSPQTQTEEIANLIKIPQKSKDARGGRRRQADPAEVQRIVEKVKEDERNLEKDLEKLLSDKERVLFDLADLRGQEKNAQENNLSGFTKKHISEAISHIQRKLQKINGVLPEVDHSKDQAKITKIIKDWEEGKKEFSMATGKIVKGEHILEKDPKNVAAQRDVNTGHAERLVAQEKIIEATIAAKHTVETNEQNPAQNESIGNIGSLVREENIQAKVERVSPGVFGMKAANEEMQNEMNSLVHEEGAEIETDEGHHHEESLPTVVEEKVILPLVEETPAEKVEETVGFIVPDQEEAIEKFEQMAEKQEKIRPVLASEKIAEYAERNTETRKRVIEGILAEMSVDVDKRAEKSKCVDKIRAVGEWWNKLPGSFKYMFAGGMLVSGIGAVAIGSTAAIGMIGAVSAGSRALTGAGLFVLLEQTLERAEEKKTGKEIDADTKMRHTLEAAVFAAIFVAIVPKLAGEFASTHFGAETTTANQSHAGMAETIKATPKIDFTVNKGETLWHGIKHAMEEKGLFEGMGRGQKNHMVDAIKDRFATMSSEELQKNIGIPSGNVNLVYPGDRIDLTSVLGDMDIVQKVTENAANLSPEEITSIESFSPAEAPVATPPIETVAEHTMPQEIIPGDSQVLAYANQTITQDMETLFGEKGFFGLFGGAPWEKSIHMMDPQVGFMGKTVDEILKASPSAFPEDGARHFGIEDFSATKKAQEYIQNVIAQSGVQYEPKEKFLDYAKRAAAIKISAFMNNG